jgi:hypothetical protein
VVGSPTHPVIPNLVVLWEIIPLRGGVRAGTRLWAREARGAIGSELKPGAAGGEPGPLRGQARRPARVTY